MKKYANLARAALLAAFAFFASVLPEGALAQTVTALPTVISGGGAVTDLGNGPLEIRVAQGNFLLFTEQATGLGSTSGASTTLTLTASAAANPPCVGCVISGAGITPGTTVAAFNGTTTITLSAAMTVAASTPLAWGMACPASAAGIPVLPVQANVGADYPMYTYARLCGSSQNSAGAMVIGFPIGAH